MGPAALRESPSGRPFALVRPHAAADFKRSEGHKVGTALETRSTPPLTVSVRKEPTVIDVCELSVVIPTRNEAGNIVALREQLSRALIGHSYEVIVVDDSNDAETRPLLRA